MHQPVRRIDFRRFIRIAIGIANFSYFQLVGDVEENDIEVRVASWALDRVNMRSCCT